MPALRGQLRATLVACVAAMAAAPSAGASVEVRTTPSLYPAFDLRVPVYVSRCDPDRPVRVVVDATGGDRVAVNRHSARGGSFTTEVRRRTGARFSFEVRTKGGFAKTYQVRCLPVDFPRWTFRRAGKPQSEWYVVTPVTPPRGGYAAIFDTNGVPVWWRRSSRWYIPWDAKLLDRGLLAIGHNYYAPFGVKPESGYEETTLDGRVVREIHTSGSPTDVHDLERLPNGHLLAITYRRREHVDLSAYGGIANARVFDGEIQELTSTGKLVWSWNSQTHFSPSETQRAYWYNTNGPQPPPSVRGYDLLHVNAVQPDGDGLLVSARHLDAVFRINRATGAVEWKLGGTFVLGESLTVLGLGVGEHPLSGQHDVRLWKDGTLTVYDNGTDTGERPAAERFRIDPLARTATLVERVTVPSVKVSKWGGSARKLPGGNWVVCWAGAPLVTEQTPTGAVLTALHFTGEERSYRADPLLPGRVSASDIRRAMDRMVGN